MDTQKKFDIWSAILDGLWTLMLLIQVGIAKFNGDTNDLIFWMGILLANLIIIFRVKKAT